MRRNYKLVLCLTTLILLITCTKLEKQILVTTGEVTNIQVNSAEAAGTLIDLGEGVVQYGHYYSKSPDPAKDILHTAKGKPEGTGAFMSQITGLDAGTKYYIVAYAGGEKGNYFGNIKSFTTLLPPPLPTAVSTYATSLNISTAALHGIVNANGSDTEVTFEYGLTSEYGNMVTASNSPVTGNAEINVDAIASGLSFGTTYHFRVKAVNAGGTAYGADQAFSLECILPVAITEPATSVTSSTATLKGFVDPNDFSTTVSFEYGLTASYGNTADGAPSPVTGNGNVPVSGGISDLAANTTYHYRVKAINCGGTTYGADQTFVTSCIAPSATVNTATLITGTMATLNGTVNPNGFVTTVSFEYGLTTTYGNVKGASPSPVSGNSNVPVSANISGLSVGTLYHYRLVTVNCAGTFLSPDFTFNTCELPVAASNSATSITYSTATLNGTINAKGFSASISFEYGLTTNYGYSAPATPGNVTGSTNTSVSAGISGLGAGTTYHYRLKAVNCAGTVYSNDMTFATCMPPSTGPGQSSNVTSTGATLQGVVYANGYSTTVSFEYGTTTSYGSTVTATPSVATGTGYTPVSASLSGLIPNTLYHFRIKAVSCGGTTYGSDLTFTTPIAIGDTYRGGKVAYIFESYDPGYVAGEVHGIIAAPGDLANSFTGCWGTVITGALGGGIGAGMQNTIDIVSGCPSVGIAARICYDLSLNGYSDWYLPGRSELLKLYASRSLIGNFNTSTAYWSSTRESSTSWRYYAVSFVDGTYSSTNFDSGDVKPVRPIRYF